MPFICPKYHPFGDSILAILSSPLVPLAGMFWLCVCGTGGNPMASNILVRKAPERRYFLLNMQIRG